MLKIINQPSIKNQKIVLINCMEEEQPAHFHLFGLEQPNLLSK